MALTNAQRVEIRRCLGWSARFRQFDSRLEMAFNALDAMFAEDPDTTTLVLGLLPKIAAVEAELLDAHTNLQAEKLGSISLDGAKQIAVLRSEGRRFVGQLSATLGVPVRHDIFSGRAPSTFASPRGMVPEAGGGNLPRLG
jgi:hypothetical protein